MLCPCHGCVYRRWFGRRSYRRAHGLPEQSRPERGTHKPCPFDCHYCRYRAELSRIRRAASRPQAAQAFDSEDLKALSNWPVEWGIRA
jgi:hypothetical protein